MAETILISPADVAKYTALNGNIDPDKFIQHLKVAQDIHVLGYLGTDLLDKLKSDAENGTLIGDYLELNTTYVKPCLIHWAAVESLPFLAYAISNKGIYKHNSENSSTVDKAEVDFLVEKERDIAQHYSRLLVNYLVANGDKFPEYLSNDCNDTKPSTNTSFSGWSFT